MSDKNRFTCYLDGTVACLEQGCEGVSIPLIPRVKFFDGGRGDGLGSLSAYRVCTFLFYDGYGTHLLFQHHIEDHPSHAKNRLARIKVELAGSGIKGSVVSRSPTLFHNTALISDSCHIGALLSANPSLD
jgi:hypothetical protein